MATDERLQRLMEYDGVGLDPSHWKSLPPNGSVGENVANLLTQELTVTSACLTLAKDPPYVTEIDLAHPDLLKTRLLGVPGVRDGITVAELLGRLDMANGERLFFTEGSGRTLTLTVGELSEKMVREDVVLCTREFVEAAKQNHSVQQRMNAKRIDLSVYPATLHGQAVKLAEDLPEISVSALRSLVQELRQAGPPNEGPLQTARRLVNQQSATVGVFKRLKDLGCRFLGESNAVQPQTTLAGLEAKLAEGATGVTELDLSRASASLDVLYEGERFPVTALWAMIRRLAPHRRPGEKLAAVAERLGADASPPGSGGQSPREILEEVGPAIRSLCHRHLKNTLSGLTLMGALEQLGEHFKGAALKPAAVPPDVWISRDGRRTRICEMSDQHLCNALAMLKRGDKSTHPQYQLLVDEASLRGLNRANNLSKQAAPVKPKRTVDPGVTALFAAYAEARYGCSIEHLRRRRLERRLARNPIHVSSGNLTPESVKVIEALFASGDGGERTVARDSNPAFVTAADLRTSRGGPGIGTDIVPYPEELV